MKNQKNDLAGDTIVARNKRLLTAELDGELVAMSVEQGACYSLDAVGTRIWALIAEPRSIDDLCAQLVREYEVEPAECRSDVMALIRELRDEGLATIRSG